jgi:hypothetical protein
MRERASKVLYKHLVIWQITASQEAIEAAEVGPVDKVE